MQQSSLSGNLESEILRLKKERNAVILAHYYQEGELQDIADFIGDSLDLSRKAAATDAETIVFCGVRFMAETAKILSPKKTVLVPDMNAGCSLESSCPPAQFKAFRAAHPDHIALTYINCSAEVKALSDIIVTSSNAEAILNQIPKDQKIIFAPDRFLGGYLMRKTGREMTLWQGSCMVHEQFSEKELVKLKTLHSQAKIIAHPECPEHLLGYAEFIGSTSALLRYTEQVSKAQCTTEQGEARSVGSGEDSPAREAQKEFIVMTEPGILHQMKKRSTGSVFYDVPGMNDGACISCNTCPYMKLNTMEKLYECLANNTPELTLASELIAAARKPLERMLEMSQGIQMSAA